MLKKAQGLSVNFIIIALIAIAVLIVILFVFGGRAKIFTDATTSYCTCTDVLNAQANKCPDGQIVGYRTLKTTTQCGNTQIKVYENGDIAKCCIPIGEG